jgi:hypothetical protein
MTDGFIATVVSNNMDGTWTVLPKIIEYDGTPHIPIKVNAVDGLYPVTGDTVMVVTIRNNLDDSNINRYYKASESNGRIIGIATPVVFYQFKGNYKYTGDIILDGNLTILGDLTMTGDLTVAKSITVAQDITVVGNLDVTGSGTMGTLTVGGINFLTHTHANNAPAPGPTGPPT